MIGPLDIGHSQQFQGRQNRSGLRSTGFHAGAIGYLIMDRASEELAAAIKRIAAGGTYLSPGIAGLTARRPS